MRKKRIMLVLMTLILVLPSFLVSAASNESTKVEDIPKSAGDFSSKDEVVYATLSATGVPQESYVVNIFDVKKAGKIVDYGSYSSIKNLTNLSEIKHLDDQVEFPAPTGKFYYQGTMENEPLPWDIRISYSLDGKEVSPEELAGKDGHVELNIHTSTNEKVNQIFFENYLLQVSLTLNPDIYQNIEATDGIVANVGKNKQVTFTVMPEKEGEFAIKADVVDFELDGIEIAAIPSSMSIDPPDMEEMTGDMESLTDAISEVNNGVGEVKKGISQLNDGVMSLRDGSKQYNNGMTDISAASRDLIVGSESIYEALATINKSLLENSEQMDFTELEKLPAGLSEISAGLNEMADGLSFLRENYAKAYSTLDGAMMGIPEHELSEEKLQGLYMSGADAAVLDKLIETYSAARTAKGTYVAVKDGFDAVDVTLLDVSGGLREIAKTLNSIGEEFAASLEEMDLGALSELQEGLAKLSAKYGEFHSGLTGYTKGVGQLSASYNEIHAGIVEMSGGSGELEEGVGELHNGTATLFESTSDLPKQMQADVDKMIAEFDKSDFDAVSFVSSKNEKVNSVQFVIKTESITIEEPVTKAKADEDEKGFWDRLKELFF